MSLFLQAREVKYAAKMEKLVYKYVQDRETHKENPSYALKSLRTQ